MLLPLWQELHGAGNLYLAIPGRAQEDSPVGLLFH